MKRGFTALLAAKLQSIWRTLADFSDSREKTPSAQSEAYVSLVRPCVGNELKKHRDQCMGGPESLKALRTRLTGRDRDFIGLGTDRVLWSILWSSETAGLSERAITPGDFELTEDELPELASLGFRHGIDLLAERVDRVFLRRALRCLCRADFCTRPGPAASRIFWSQWRMSHGFMVHMVCHLMKRTTKAAPSRISLTSAVYTPFEMRSKPWGANVGQVARELTERRTQALKQGQIPVLDAYARGPSLWLGADPVLAWTMRRKTTTRGPGLYERSTTN